MHPRRGSIEGPSGRRRRSSSASTSRHSLDESQLQHDDQYAYAQQQQQRHSDIAASAVNVGHEVSEMLRDAMQLVRKQKQEILELKTKLKATQAYAQEQAVALATAAAMAATAEATAEVETQTRASDVEAAVVELPTADEYEEQHQQQDGEEERVGEGGNCSNGVQDAVEMETVADEAEPVAVADSRREMRKEDVDIDIDEEEEDAEPSEVAVPAAPLSAPAVLTAGSSGENADFFSRSASLGSTDFAAMFAASSGSSGFKRSSYSGNEYLQQQAMELAEIARNLQSSFRTDFAVSIVCLYLVMVLACNGLTHE